MCEESLDSGWGAGDDVVVFGLTNQRSYVEMQTRNQLHLENCQCMI